MHAFMAMLLVACSTQPVDHRSERKRAVDLQLEQSGQRTDKIAYQQTNSALSYYEQIDDRSGQWQANVSLADWHVAHDEKAKAEPYARRALYLAEKLDERSMKFTSSIQLGQLTEDQSLYRQAYNNAQTGLQRAIALTFLQQYDEAEKSFTGIGSSQNPDELGFLYYQYGKHKRELRYVLLALDNYRKADNVYGVIDSLFLAARLAEHGAAATDYAERALLAAEGIGSKARAGAIQEWMKMRAEE